MTDDDLMTPVEFAAHAKVSRRTVFRWLADGMPALRRGRVVRIEPRVADAWLLPGRRR